MNRDVSMFYNSGGRYNVGTGVCLCLYWGGGGIMYEQGCVYVYTGGGGYNVETGMCLCLY